MSRIGLYVLDEMERLGIDDEDGWREYLLSLEDNEPDEPSPDC